MKTSPADFSSFVRRLVIFTAIVAILAFGILYFLPPAWKTPALPYLVLFYFSVTVVVHYILLKATARRFASFINYYLGSTFIKLMIYFIVLILYVITHKEDALPFGVTFFLLYVCFTGFEVYALLNNTRSGPAPGQDRADQGIP